MQDNDFAALFLYACAQEDKWTNLIFFGSALVLKDWDQDLLRSNHNFWTANEIPICFRWVFLNIGGYRYKDISILIWGITETNEDSTDIINLVTNIDYQ